MLLSRLDQHIILIRLILFVYMKTQGSVFPLCVSMADVTGSKWIPSAKIGGKSEAPYVLVPSYFPRLRSLYIRTCSCYSNLSGTSPEAHEGLVSTSGKHSDSALLLL